MYHYSGNLNSKLFRYLNVWRAVRCQMVQFLKVIWILDSPTILIPVKWKPSCFLMYSGGSNTKRLKTESIRKPYVLKIQTKWPPFFDKMVAILFYHSKSEQTLTLRNLNMFGIRAPTLLVLYLNGRSSTKDIAHQPTIWIPNHLESELQKVWYSFHMGNRWHI